MKFEMIEANTHSSEYLMHKYWARKPHNVISHFLKEYVPENGSVLDPFMGSGVVINEALNCGFDATGIDVNPVAYNITKVLTTSIDIEKFENTLNKIINDVEKMCSSSYKLSTGEDIKYMIHNIIVRCSNCLTENSPSTCVIQGKKCFCSRCGEQIHFNLENLYDTEISGICINGDKNIVTNESELRRQHIEADKNITGVVLEKYNEPCTENKRILAYNGLKTGNFFTKRNFSILCYMADRFHEIEDEKIRNAALCLLTASSAQCSRLIPYRNNLSTGGPAWSVPGFWVPQNHLETNPIIHIKARYKKIVKGLQELHGNNSDKLTLINDDSIKLISENRLDKKFDLVFLDPPYGDSVPYTEFSHFWNSFLKNIPNVNDDISVSDRLPKNEAWKNYEKSMNTLFKYIPYNLNDNGKIVITFNNNDLKAWKALISPLQENKFKCIGVNYQIPAVISSKASFCPTSSYISDIYSVYELNENSNICRDISGITNKLINCASVRSGLIYLSIIDREFIMEILKNNIDCKVLDDKKEIIDSLFTIYNKKDKIYKLKDEFYNENLQKLKDVIYNKVSEFVKQGETNLYSIYKKVAPSLNEFGIPELYEFKQNLSNFVVSGDKILGFKEI